MIILNDTVQLGVLPPPPVAATSLCRDNTTTEIVQCPANANNTTLQLAYDAGNTITTTDARDIAFTLSDTATDSNFTVLTSAGSTGYSAFSLEDGLNPTPAGQIVLINNADTNQAIASGLKITSAAGGITNGIDLSDSDIVNALSLGANDVAATNFSITGATGDITTAGNLAVNGGDITTTFAGTATLFNTNATALNIGGAATTVSIGAGTGTTAVNNNFTVAGAGTTQFNGITYTWPGSQGAGYVLRTNGSGTLSWIDAAGIGYLTQSNGLLYPINSTVDFALGGTATSSSKFAVINVNSGTPTATLSAGTNGGLYVTANGTIQTPVS